MTLRSAQFGTSPGARPVVFDVSRLVTRALNATPNGIDRVDFALARHFLSGGGPNAALVCTALGPRLFSAADACRTVGDIEAHWNEFIAPSEDPVHEAIVAAIVAAFDATPTNGKGIRRARRRGADFVAENWRAMKSWAFRLGRPISEVPEGAVYFNASQFLVDKGWFVRWLSRRPDVKPVFFVHDLLPIEAPEFFRPGEPPKHLAAMRNVCRLASGVVVGSRAVERSLRAFAASNGRRELPICVAGLPLSPAFETPAAPDVRLSGLSYFVVCGTIEPRKNHALLLNVWRELAMRGKDATPKLVIVGKRGWRNENVLDLLERSEILRPHVIEAAGLSTPALRKLLAGARALLMPSYGEGFGLPIIEAAQGGTPVVCSDIEAFREIGGNALDYVDPLDGLGWLAAIEAYSDASSPRRADALARLSRLERRDSASFFRAVDAFIESL